MSEQSRGRPMRNLRYRRFFGGTKTNCSTSGGDEVKCITADLPRVVATQEEVDRVMANIVSGTNDMEVEKENGVQRCDLEETTDAQSHALEHHLRVRDKLVAKYAKRRQRKHNTREGLLSGWAHRLSEWESRLAEWEASLSQREAALRLHSNHQ